MWLWMSTFHAGSCVLEAAWDTRTPSPVKVWTQHFLYNDHLSLTNMGFSWQLHVDSFYTGDSGGSLFLQRRKRYFQVSHMAPLNQDSSLSLSHTHTHTHTLQSRWHFSCFYLQVGVVSWGTTNVCAQPYSSDRPPRDARDFHIDLFEILPWLKQHLGEEIQFLPEVNWEDPELVCRDDLLGLQIIYLMQNIIK